MSVCPNCGTTNSYDCSSVLQREPNSQTGRAFCSVRCFLKHRHAWPPTAPVQRRNLDLDLDPEEEAEGFTL